MFRSTRSSKLLALAVLAGIPAAAVAGPLTGTAAAAPKKHAASAPVYTTSPAAVTNAVVAQFAWTAPTTSYTYTCYLDGGRVGCTHSSTAWSYTSGSLANGSHTWTVKASGPTLRPRTSSYSWRIDSVPPAAPSVTAPPSPTQATSVAVAFSDADSSVTGFTCALDGAAAAPCTTPFQASGLGEGQHGLVVTARDAAGNTASTSTTWTVDRTAPDVPAIVPPASPTKLNALSITFSTVQPASYTCTVDAGTPAACTSPLSLTGLADGAHRLTVSARDGAGNTSSSSVSWIVDTTPPPAPSLVTAPASPTDDLSPTVEFADFDPSGIFYACSLTDDTAGTTVDGPAACTSPYDATIADTTPDGEHFTAHIQPTDGAGNVGAPLTVSWVLDQSTTGVPVSPPVFLVGPSMPSRDTQPVFGFDAPDYGQSGGATQFLCALDKDPSAAASYTVCATPDSNGDGTYTVSAPLADGAHTFALETSNGTNTSAPVMWNWIVDTSAPPAASVSDPGTAPNPTITFADGDNTVTYLCSVDGGSFVACSNPWTPPAGLADGTHSLVVRVVDEAGNSTDSPTVTFTTSHAPASQPATQPSSGTSGDTTAPTVSSLTTPSALTGSAVATFSEQVSGLNAAAVTMAVTGAGTTVPSGVVCLAGSTPTSCSGAFTAVRITPAKPLVPGQRYTVVIGAGATHDLAGNASVAASAAFRAATTVEENGVAVVGTWPLVKAKAAYGGSFVREHQNGATASWTFTGTSVTWWTVTGPDQGKATVYVDGVKKSSANNYSSAKHLKVARTIKGLKKGTHTIKIQVLGAKGAKKATGTFVSVDAFTVGKSLTKTPALAMTLRRVASSRYLGGHATVGDLAGQTVSMTFRGTGITWLTSKGNDQGKAAIYVDGVLKATIDDYAAKTSYKVKHTVGHLADKVHTVKIVVLGKHHKGGKGNLVTIDRFTVA